MTIDLLFQKIHTKKWVSFVFIPFPSLRVCSLPIHVCVLQTYLIDPVPHYYISFHFIFLLAFNTSWKSYLLVYLLSISPTRRGKFQGHGPWEQCLVHSRESINVCWLYKWIYTYTHKYTHTHTSIHIHSIFFRKWHLILPIGLQPAFLFFPL